MLCAFCTNMAAAFALAVVQDWFIYLRCIRLAKFSKSRRNCRRILFLFINTLHGPTYRQTNNLKRTLRPSNRKPSIRYKVYREGVCHPETQQQRGKRNIAFRDTVPALNVCFNEKKKWKLIQNQPLLHQIFKEPPIISYKEGKSLKDMLVRAKI